MPRQYVPHQLQLLQLSLNGLLRRLSAQLFETELVPAPVVAPTVQEVAHQMRHGRHLQFVLSAQYAQFSEQ